MRLFRSGRGALGAICLVVAAVMLVPSLAGAERPSETKRYGKVSKRCGGLKGHAVFKTNKILVVKRLIGAREGLSGYEEDPGAGYSTGSGTLFGCARPSGIVHRLDFVGTFEAGCCTGTTSKAKFGQAAGVYVLYHTVAEGGGEDYRVDDDRTRVLNMRTGKSIVLDETTLSKQDEGDDETIVGARVDASGRATALYDQPGTSGSEVPVRRLFAFSAKGKRSFLDQGPATALPLSDLKISGATVTWSNAGVSKTATVSETAVSAPSR